MRALRVARLMSSGGDTSSAWTVAGKSGRKENVASNKQMANGSDERRWAGPKAGSAGPRRPPRTDAPTGGPRPRDGSGAADVNSLRDAVAHARSGTGEVRQAIMSATFSPRAPCYTALIQQCARTKSWCALSPFCLTPCRASSACKVGLRNESGAQAKGAGGLHDDG